MEVGSIRHLNIGLVGSTLNRNVICDQQGLGRLEVKAQHRVCEIIRARVYAQGHILAKDDHGICEHMTLQEVDLQTQASMLMCLVSFCGPTMGHSAPSFQSILRVTPQTCKI